MPSEPRLALISLTSSVVRLLPAGPASATGGCPPPCSLIQNRVPVQHVMTLGWYARRYSASATGRQPPVV